MMTKIDRNYRDKLATFAYLVIIITGIKLSANLIIPFIFAGFLSVVTMPVVKLFKKIRMNHSLAVLLSLSFIISLFVIVGQFFYSSMKTLTGNLRSYYDILILKINSLPYYDLLAKYGITNNSIKESIEPQSIVGIGVNALGMFSSLSANLFLVMIITAFMMLEVDSVKNKIARLTKKNKEVPGKIVDFVVSVRKYLLIKTLISLVTAFIVGLGLYLLEVPHFVLFSVIAFFLNYIPTIGSIVAAVPAITLAFIVGSPSTAVAVVALYGITNIGLGSIVEPRLMGENLGLSTLIVFSSLLIFGWIFGSAGMLLAVPLTMIVKIAADKNEKWHWVSEAMSSR